jgi:hypothetical protein
MNTKQQVLIIRGGTTFTTENEYQQFLQTCTLDINKLRLRKDWKDSIQEKLGESFDVFQPRMPNTTNARYEDWKVWLDKIIPLLDNNIIVIGHSLGGIFLVKYLSEQRISKRIKALFLVAAPFDNTGMTESLASFSIQGSQKLSDVLQDQVKHIFLYYSTVDLVVPFAHAKKYQDALPQATLRSFDNRGHFKQEDFPELIEDIRECA